MKHNIFFFYIIAMTLPGLALGDYYIEDFAGQEADYQVIRDGNIFQFRQFEILKAGDVIKVLNDHGRITLSSNDSEKTELNKGNGAFTVPQRSEPASIGSNVIAWINSWFNKRRSLSVKEIITNVRGNNAPFILLGISDLNNLVLPGLNSLTLHWSGSQAPYHVRLSDQSKNVIVEAHDIQDTHVVLDNLQLTPGIYRLETRSEMEFPYLVKFKVSDQQQMPEFANEIINSDLPEKVKQGYLALTLSAHEEWQFQALQIAEKYQFEQIKRDILCSVRPTAANGATTHRDVSSPHCEVKELE